MCKWVTADQGTVEWLKARQGCLTASRMADAMAVLKKGGESEARKKLKLEILSERLTGFCTPTFVNDAMKWGIEYEAEARAAYEDATGNIVMGCGLALHDHIPFFGASPDGLIHDGEGTVEIKCPTSTTHLSWLLAGEVPEQHRPQMLAQLACTGRKYVDFVSYDPRFPAQQRTFIKRFEPAPEEIAATEEAARAFLAEAEQLQQQLVAPREATCPFCHQTGGHSDSCPEAVPPGAP